MQSMFRLPWSTEAPGDKIMEKAALHKSRPLPVVDMASFMKLKRKRTDSPEPASPQHAHVVKKWKSAQGDVAPASALHASADRIHEADYAATGVRDSVDSADASMVVAAHVMESRTNAGSAMLEGASKSKDAEAQKPAAGLHSADNSATTAMETDLTRARQAIEAQFNYEILLKHQELRLIEQELAKCQVSLEQLRRCSLIPFPGTEGVSLDVSGGVGPALQPPSGYTEPQHAASWGVVDGPYTRHYAKWLIPDPKFDPMPVRELAQQTQGGYFGIGGGRTTRGSFAEFGTIGKARTSRTSTGTLKLQALGENPAPAPKVDPLLHKRSTDGQWVRLYCAQCGHSNFSNTQGFLNHCRIKHNQVFKSHDQAAIACGIPVDMNEVGNPVSAIEPPSTTATTPAATFSVPLTAGVVHPLIKTNPSEMAQEVYRDFNRPTKDQTTAKPQALPVNFTTSPSTPYMNALLQKRGFAGDLKHLVDVARTKVDIDSMETSDDESATQTPVTVKPQQLTRLPVTAPAATASKASSTRPSSKKGQMSAHARLPHLPSPVNVSADAHHVPISPSDLSPHTVESNPGLVSDHDDDDDDDADDAKSQPDIVMNDDVLVEDASDVEGVTAERTGSRNGLEGCFQKGEGSRKH